MNLALFPAGVQSEVRPTALSEGAEPLPEAEAGAMEHAVPARVAEFITGRWCARRALQRLGYGGVAIPRAPDRSPVWPAGVVGSITHCVGFIGAAVARADHLGGLGFDAELRREFPPEELDAFLTPPERERAHSGASPHWPMVVFSAKEAIYKAVFPLCREPFDFLDVEVTTNWPEGTFTARPAPDAPACIREPVGRILGRFTITTTHVVTAAWLPARGEQG